MKISSELTDEALLDVLGKRLAAVRLAKNLTQQQVAEQAGVGLSTVHRLEQGAAASQLSSFIRICRVLGLVENLDALVPEPIPSPIDQLKREGQKRQRARASHEKPLSDAKPWTWDDQA
jgi:transcriptional regulator with XRE-family HTH domain